MPTSPRAGRWLCLALSFVVSHPSWAAKGDAPSAARPRLAVVMVVDQMRYDYLERFGSLFGEGGFRWLQSHGASFTNAQYGYVPTFTAPGHASIATGSVPSQHGIVGNTFYDRDSGRVLGMVADESVSLLRSPGATPKTAGKGGLGQSFDAAASPRNLKATTLGDQLRLASQGRARVVSAALKDRSAILSAGLRPTGAYWFDADSGSMVSSTYYGNKLPAWVDGFNAQVRPEAEFGKAWEPSARTAAVSQAKNTEAQGSSLGKAFPYRVGEKGGDYKKSIQQFELSPLANDYVVAFAKAALDGEQLGRRGETDLLAVSFSSPDLLGHAYGPDSREVAEMYVALDRAIANLIAEVTKRVPAGDVVFALSADHGVSPVPAYLNAQGYPAGKLAVPELIRAVNESLAKRFGGGPWLKTALNDQLYLDRKLIEDRKLDRETVQMAAGEAAMRLPGVRDYFTYGQLARAQTPDTPIGRRAVLGFDKELSGDVLLVLAPFWFLDDGSVAATHGSGYHYDAHVPVILAGPGVKPGRYAQAASPSDLAPTLAQILRIEAPTSTTGRVLHEALR